MFATVGFTLLSWQRSAADMAGTAWRGAPSLSAWAEAKCCRSLSSARSMPGGSTRNLQRTVCRWPRVGRGTCCSTYSACSAYGLGAELLNFGALIAFMGVNLAALLAVLRDREGKHNGAPPRCSSASHRACPPAKFELDAFCLLVGNCFGSSCRMDAAARGIHDLFLFVEESKLESLDRRRNLDGRWYRVWCLENSGIPW